jgi:hypothetical protein
MQQAADSNIDGKGTSAPSDENWSLFTCHPIGLKWQDRGGLSSLVQFRGSLKPADLD